MKRFLLVIGVLLCFSCTKNNTNSEVISPEQAFLKPFATTEVPGQWKFDYHDGWEGQYDKIKFNNDGIYDFVTQSYYGTGEVTCVGLIWGSETEPDTFVEVCKGGAFPDGTDFMVYPVQVKWKLQYKEGGCRFMWASAEIDFNSIPDHILSFPLLKGTSEYKTKFVVSDDGSSTYDVDVTKLNP